MAGRYSTDSSPTVVAPPPSGLKAPSSPPPSSSASALDGDLSIDTQALYRASPALTFPHNLLHAVAQFSLVLVLLPYHFVLFALAPRKRWRSSWTLTEAALMPAVKRIMSTMDTCGYKIGARRTDAAPGAVGRWWIRVRHGVRFEWVDGLEGEWVGGVLADEEVRVREKVGVYSWTRKGVGEREGLVGLWLHGGGASSFLALSATKRRFSVIRRRR